MNLCHIVDVNRRCTFWVIFFNPLLAGKNSRYLYARGDLAMVGKHSKLPPCVIYSWQKKEKKKKKKGKGK